MNSSLPTAKSYPFKPEGPVDFYPAVCLKYHTDPTNVLKHVLPEGNFRIHLPMDPRPWAKICTTYRNSGTDEAAPSISPQMVFPSGGSTYEPNRYLNAVDEESDLRGLKQALRKCDTDQYLPRIDGDMFNNSILIPRKTVHQDHSFNLSMPKVLMTAGPDPCRLQDDLESVKLSSKRFNNATKQDRYYKS